MEALFWLIIILLLIISLLIYKKTRTQVFATYGPHVLCESILTTCNPKTIGELFYKRAHVKPDAPAFYEKHGTKWCKTTWGSFFKQASMLASYFVNDLKLPRGSKICILGPTRSKWVISDMGAMLSGSCSVGIYPNQTYQQYKYILEHCDCDVIILDGEEELIKILKAIEGIKTVKSIVVWDDAIVGKGAYPAKVIGWSETQKSALEENVLMDRISLLHPQDTAVMVYTSGTTGPPKGVMLSHTNILSLARSLLNSTEVFEDDLSFNFLPLSHVAERFLGFYARLDKGITNCFATSIGQVIQEIQEVKPTLFGSVPRIFEKAHTKIYSDVAKRPKYKQVLFHWAIKTALARNELIFSKMSVPLKVKIQHKIAHMMLKPVRNALGGRVRQMIVGAAPINKKLLEFFWACGLRVYELYGLTEVTAVCFANRPACFKLGTVGKVVRNVECKIASDGELLVRAPFVFEGYFKNPEATLEVKDKDGWLHTGDIVKLDAEGFLTITDRKKHLIITSGGKNLSPSNIEKAVRSTDPYISQVHAHGDNRPFVVAIITPSPVEALECAVAHNLLSQSECDRLVQELINNPFMRSSALNLATAKITSHPAFVHKIRKAVESGNSTLSNVEQVKKFYILDRDFSQEHGELTPTMKMKRRDIEMKFKSTFDQLYDVASFGYNVNERHE